MQWGPHMIIISALLNYNHVCQKMGTFKKYMYIYDIIWSSHDMTVDERSEIPTCNLAETMHDRWVQQSRNKMICVYEATMDALMRVFMQIANDKLRLKRGNN